MGLNETPSANRVHIAFFGCRNAGKSSLVNAVTGQELAVVSQTLGTTTDPVSKSMELLPMGPVVIIDTPGFDDEGALGELRVRKTRQVLNRADVAVLVADCTVGLRTADRELLNLFRQKELPYIIAWNKCDLKPEYAEGEKIFAAEGLSDSTEIDNAIFVSAEKKINIHALKEKIAHLGRTEEDKKLVGDLIAPGDMAVLVIPIDSAAPKGRLILPQQQTIRDILDAGGAAVCVRESELKETLAKFAEAPAMVITDSQVFAQVAEVVPDEILLTSFSILMARYKGLLDTAVRGVAAIEKLQDGDTVLIAEGCTHHRQCDDIGSVKLPRWLKNYTGKSLNIELCSGREFPEDLSKYAMVIHCGGCMLNEREVRYRMKCAVDQNTPITNYGIAIAYMQGILKRSIRLFPELLKELEG